LILSMNILYVCHRIPYPPNKGEKIRALQQIKHLSRRHHLHLFCLADRREDIKEADNLKEFCQTVEVEYLNSFIGKLKSLPSLLFSSPMTLKYFYSAKLMAKVNAAAAKIHFDIAIAYSSGMIPYIERLDMPKVYDMVDLDSQKWLQYSEETPFPFSWIYNQEGKNLFEYEKSSSRQAEVTLFVSKEEGRILKEKGNPKRVEAVASGVDLDFYDINTPPDQAISAMNRPTMIFVGAMDYKPNIVAVRRFADQVLPKVSKEIKDPLFLIVGSSPAAKVQALDRNPNIIVTGRVDDTRPYLKAAQAAVIPLTIARGMQTKVLEAMAMSLPVVLTGGAATGIDGESGRDYIISDTDQEIADAVIMLLKNKDKAKMLGSRARDYIEKNFNWRDKVKQYEVIIEEIANNFSKNKAKGVR